MSRLHKMYELREHAAKSYRELGLEAQTPNGDEAAFPDLRATFTKGLLHDSTTGLLKNRADFDALYQNIGDIEPAPGTFNPFVDPQAGLAFDTEGPDAHQLALPAPPKFDSDLEIAEIAENYWMALLRDVPFANYTASAPDPLVTKAVNHLKTLTGYESVTPGTLFRGPLPGESIAPYLSQFLVWDVPYGSQKTPAQVAFGLPDGTDFMTDWNTWLDVQNGVNQPNPPVAPVTPHYFSKGRDMAQYVHIDELFQAYLNACLILITPTKRGGFGALIDQGNPYVGAITTDTPPAARHSNQVGFGTLGEPNFKTLVAEVATRALKQVWSQKWFVHRRLRPEAFGGRLEAQRTGAIHGFISDAQIAQLQPVLDEVKAKFGNWLLPQAFPEGSPVHPAYGAGHATVAGACVTVLKALFYEEAKLSDLGVSPMTIAADGTRVHYTGSDAGEMTVLSELNKLASNIGLSRDIAGVHWRTDYTESVVLGERIALYFLQETANTYHENVTFHVQTFGGKPVVIEKGVHQTFGRYSLGQPMTQTA
jgi:hypothetical protein